MGNDPVFDPEWLAAIGASFGRTGGRDVRVEDLYLQRSVERRLDVEAGELFGAETREDGCAIRWGIAGRTVLSCESGVSPLAVRRAAEAGRGALSVPDVRPRRAVELEIPESWNRWALGIARRLGGDHGSVRYMQRRAAVVGPDGWVEIRTPALTLVRREGVRPVSVLAVWGRSELDDWVEGALGSKLGTWRPPDGACWPVVFTDGTGAALIHEVVGHLSESDLVRTRVSPLAGLEARRLSPESITIVDDPRREDLPGGFDADDEGVVAEPRAIVREGRLTGWLCDREGAAVLNDRPGRGRRSSWRVAPVPRMSNLTVVPGSRRSEDIEASVDRGLIVTRVGAATVDPAAGRVVVRVDQGWELVRGRRERSLQACHVSGSVPEILGGIAPEIGDDPTPDRHLGWCSKGGSTLPTGCETPTLLVDGLETVSGDG